MKRMTKNFARSAAIAIGLVTLTPLAASAGEWRLNARACPDLREDRQDARRDNGWRDRREDRRDQRVINCPARAWTYIRYRGESARYRPVAPRYVVVYPNGRYYYRNTNGSLIALNVDFSLWNRRG